MPELESKLSEQDRRMLCQIKDKMGKQLLSHEVRDGTLKRTEKIKLSRSEANIVGWAIGVLLEDKK